MSEKILLKNINSDKIDHLLKQEIARLYIEVFSEPPRNEVIIFENIFKQIFEKNSIFTLLFQDNILIGFIDAYEIQHFTDKNKFEIKDKDSIYISAFAIDKNARGQGYGKLLFEKHLSALKEKYKYVYSRSRVDVKAIVNMFKKYNFQIILEYEVETNGVTSRKYMYEKALTSKQ